MSKRLKIVHLASEVSPFSKSGGLADVLQALPKKLAQMPYRVEKVIIITPYYGFIKKKDFPRETVAKNLTITIGDEEFSFTIKKTCLKTNLDVYFICNDKFFGQQKLYGYENDGLRFYFFNLASLKLLEAINFSPDIIHCHDWQTGLVPNFLKTGKFPFLASSATIFTIHNLAFQGPIDWWKIPPNKKDDGKNSPSTDPKKINYINFSKRGILYADVINAVSERYAKEILTPQFGQELEKILKRRRKDLYGIINGIDYSIYNPAFDDNIYVKYDWNKLRKKKLNKLALQKEVGLEESADTPLIGVVNRLTEQKGFDLIIKSFNTLIKLKLQLVVVGSGEKEYINFFRKMAKKYSAKLSFITPFSEQMAAKIFAGSDVFLLPSRYEPCGISQLISLRYGSIPVVHETGGLSETITNFNPKTGQGNGFVFPTYAKEDFLIALTRALENYKYQKVWEHLTWRAMKESFSWRLPAKKYLALYRIAIRKLESKNKK